MLYINPRLPLATFCCSSDPDFEYNVNLKGHLGPHSTFMFGHERQIAYVDQFIETEKETPVTTTKLSQREQELTADLHEFWAKTAKADAESVVPKAVEYGAADLRIMGTAMAGLFNAARRGAGLPEISGDELQTVGVEMSCAFYQLGKVARMFGAWERGAKPSEDCLLDDSIYSVMLRKVRTTGRWI